MFTCDELLSGSGSVTVVVTVGTIDIGPAELGMTVIVMIGVAPSATVPMLQVTNEVPEQVPVVVDAEKNVVDGASRTWATTPAPERGPRFATVSL